MQRNRAKAMEEAWEYAPLGSSTYHLIKKRLDFARRRRWVRKLVNVEPGKRPVFKFPGKKKKKKDDDADEDEDKQQVPRMYLTFKGNFAFFF